MMMIMYRVMQNLSATTYTGFTAFRSITHPQLSAYYLYVEEPVRYIILVRKEIRNKTINGYVHDLNWTRVLFLITIDLHGKIFLCIYLTGILLYIE